MWRCFRAEHICKRDRPESFLNASRLNRIKCSMFLLQIQLVFSSAPFQRKSSLTPLQFGQSVLFLSLVDLSWRLYINLHTSLPNPYLLEEAGWFWSFYFSSFLPAPTLLQQQYVTCFLDVVSSSPGTINCKSRCVRLSPQSIDGFDPCFRFLSRY